MQSSMSVFGSSAINKSGKKLAPKAPAQRRRPTAPASSSQQSLQQTQLGEESQSLGAETPSASNDALEPANEGIASVLRSVSTPQPEPSRLPIDGEANNAGYAKHAQIEANYGPLLAVVDACPESLSEPRAQQEQQMADEFLINVRRSKRRRLDKTTSVNEAATHRQTKEHIQSETGVERPMKTLNPTPQRGSNTRTRALNPKTRANGLPEQPTISKQSTASLGSEKRALIGQRAAASTERTGNKSLPLSVSTTEPNFAQDTAVSTTNEISNGRPAASKRATKRTYAASSKRARREANHAEMSITAVQENSSGAANLRSTASVRRSNEASRSQLSTINNVDQHAPSATKKRKYTKRKGIESGETDPDGSSTGVLNKNSAGSSRQNRTRNRASRQVQEERTLPTGGTANDGEEGDSTPADGAPLKKRKRRAATPEGASDHEIDAAKVTIVDLCKGSKYGKKSTRGQEMQEIDFAEVVRVRRETEERARENLIGAGGRSTEPSEQREELGTISVANIRGPQLKLVNGQMVVDNSSLVIPRIADEAPGDEETINKLTEFRNAHSWLYKDRRDPLDRFASAHQAIPWTAESTDKFYEALRMFGTDFDMISHMFPGKTRRHIKNKFVKEERSDPTRIHAALVKEIVPMDLQAYCQETGREEEDYKDPEALEEELRQLDERERAAIEKQKEEMAEILRQRQEIATAKAAKAAANKASRSKSGTNKSRKKQGTAAQAAAGASSNIGTVFSDANYTMELEDEN